jgi:hypothetical protein
LFKVDTAGTLQWSRNVFTGTGKSKFYDITICHNGDIAVCGDEAPILENPVIVRTDSLGNPRWIKEYQFGTHCNPVRIVQCKDGGFALAGDYFDMSNTHYDAMLFHTDSAGNADWAKRFYSPVNQIMIGCDIRQCRNGGYLFLCEHSKLGILMRTDSTGNRIWMKQFQGFSPASLDTSIMRISMSGNTYPAYNPDFFQLGPNGEIPCADSLLQVNQISINPVVVSQTGSGPLNLQMSVPSYTLPAPLLYSNMLCSNIDPKGIDEQTENPDVKIFPVPAISVLHVQCKTMVQHACLLNVTGQTIREFSPVSSGFQFDVSSLPPGIYFLEMQSGENILMKKIVIGE